MTTPDRPYDWAAAEEQFSVKVPDAESITRPLPCPHNAVTLEHDPRRLVCVQCKEVVEPSWMR